MELYHALNRGVEKRQIFLDNQDRARFVHDLYEFNSAPPARNTRRLFNKEDDGVESRMIDLGGRSLGRKEKEGGVLVDIHGWCIMGNHYHLLLSEREEGNLSRFLMKLNVGYAKYFNERYGRTGYVFQGRTKKVHIASQAHFAYILHYIHLNPLDFLSGAEGWRGGEVGSAEAALKHLEGYRWSSFLDYCGVRNFPSVITTELFREVSPDYRRELGGYLKDMQLDTVRNMLLE